MGGMIRKVDDESECEVHKDSASAGRNWTVLRTRRGSVLCGGCGRVAMGKPRQNDP